MPKITFVERNGHAREVNAPVGYTVLDIAHMHDVDLEGTCCGCLACATCHVVAAPEWYEKLPEKSADEEDMLDLAVGLEATSRLGCQIVMTPALDGLILRLPRG